MGVPMLRPTPGSPGSPSSPSILALNPAWLDIFRFCSIRDLGAGLAVDRHWRAAVDSHHVWADAYDRTQRVDDSSAPRGENLLRSLIERPFGEDAVGWHVAVLAEDHGYSTERYYTGRVAAYSADTDTYLIAYDSEGGQADQPNMHWEQERRKRTAAMRHNPSLAGKSRFSFLSPPPHLPKSGAVSSSTANGEPSYKAARTREERTREPLRGSWKEELKHNVLQAPSHMLTQLNEHRDEVLFVVFSPCGTRLASCSRDLQTIVFKVQTDCGSSSDQDDIVLDPSASSEPRFPRFEREAVFAHQTAPCRAMWWPIPPYDMVAVSTEDAGGGWQASKVEIWQIQGENGSVEHSESEAFNSSFEEQLPVGYRARCIFQCHNRPFDIYAAIFPWPPLCVEPSIDSPKDEYERLCFLAGWAVLRENEHYVQWLNVWPGPRHPSFQDAQAPTASGSAPRPLARLRLEGEMNYLHCLEVGPPDKVGRQQILAMTGSTPHLCNEIGLMDLSRLQRRGEGVEGETIRGPAQDGEAGSALPAVYDVGVKVYSMGERVVLSAKWNEAGDFILLNTRPYAHAASGSNKNGGHGDASHTSQAPLQGSATFEDLLLRPAPDLSTKMELLLLDARTLDILSVFDGHFAFTTKESPFLIFTEEWSDSDFLASGGEDHRVYVWHRRHGRLIRRLCGHAEPVNAVSWNGQGLLASASDDNSIIIWAAAGAKVRPQRTAAGDGWPEQHEQDAQL